MLFSASLVLWKNKSGGRAWCSVLSSTSLTALAFHGLKAHSGECLAMTPTVYHVSYKYEEL